MTSLTKSQYETIGSRAYQTLRKWEATPGTKKDYLRSMRNFLKKYESAPLFVVGVATEMMSSLIEKVMESGQMFHEFNLPYPTMILDFPEGFSLLLPGPCLAFVDTIEENRYYIELLRTEESSEEFIKNVSGFLNTTKVENQGRGIGELAGIVLEIDPLNTDKPRWIFSHEYIFDCDVPVTPHYSVDGFCTFSICNDVSCSNRTRMCHETFTTAYNMVVALCGVLNYINRPDHYVVKATPEKTEREKRLSKKGKIPSFSKKESHIVLDHSQVKEIAMAASTPNGERGPVLPHQRRGHWRNLTADFYKEKKRVWVRPSDINKGLKVTVKKCVYEVVS